MPNGSRKLVRTNFAYINRIFSPLKYYINLVFFLHGKRAKTLSRDLQVQIILKIIKYYISCLRLFLIKLDTLKDQYRKISTTKGAMGKRLY